MKVRARPGDRLPAISPTRRATLDDGLAIFVMPRPFSGIVSLAEGSPHLSGSQRAPRKRFTGTAPNFFSMRGSTSVPLCGRVPPKQPHP